MAGKDAADSDSSCRLRRAFAALESLDQVRDVRELLLEVALVVLEPLEDVVAAVPPPPEGRAEATPV